MKTGDLNTCLGCSLETGTVLIGWIQLIGGFGNLAWIIYVKQSGSKIPLISAKETEWLLNNDPLIQQNVFNYEVIIGILTWYLISILTTYMALGVLLLIAVLKKSTNLLLTWLVIQTMAICLMVVYVFTKCIFIEGNKRNIKFDPTFFVDITIFSTSVYFMIIVYSLFMKLNSDPYAIKPKVYNLLPKKP